MKTTRDHALEFLYKSLKKAKIALGQAENRSGVTHEELETLQNKVALLDYITPLVVCAEDNPWPPWVLFKALEEVKRICSTSTCGECILSPREHDNKGRFCRLCDETYAACWCEYDFATCNPISMNLDENTVLEEENHCTSALSQSTMNNPDSSSL